MSAALKFLFDMISVGASSNNLPAAISIPAPNKILNTELIRNQVTPCVNRKNNNDSPTKGKANIKCQTNPLYRLLQSILFITNSPIY
jgi:hypothetical protein